MIARTYYKFHIVARVGTRDYATPEWVNTDFYEAESNTVWQLGILLYGMLFRDPPFKSDQEISKGKLRWPRPVSSACRDIISRCLYVNWLRRSSLFQLSQHSWIAPAMESLSLVTANGLQAVEGASTSG